MKTEAEATAASGISPLADRLHAAMPARRVCSVGRLAHEAGLPSGRVPAVVRELITTGLALKPSPGCLQRTELGQLLRTKQHLRRLGVDEVS